MTGRRWIGILSIALWGTLAAASVHAETDGFSLEDFKLGSAGDLVDVCTLEPGHQHYTAAIAFCYGFFEGAIHYHEAISGTERHVDLVCDPPETTRLQAVEVFVAYLQANPQYRDEASIDAIFRALIDRWPCSE